MMVKGIRVLAVFLTLVATSTTWGQFNAFLVSPDLTGNDSPHLALDPVDNVLVVFERQDDVFFTSSLSLFDTAFNLSGTAPVTARPRIVSAVPGNAQVIFEQEGGLPGSTGNDILTLNNNGGPFGSPLSLTLSADPETHADIAQAVADPDFVWQANPAAGTPQIQIRRGFGPLTTMGDGTAPSAAAAGSITYVAYVNGNDLFYRTYDGTTVSAELPLASMAGQNESVDLASDGVAMHATFVNGGAVYYTNNSGGTFSAPVLVDAGPIDGAPSIAAAPSGDAAVAFAMGGQIFFANRSGGAFGTAINATSFASAATQPSIGIDSLSYVWIAYEETGGVYIVNNVPAPTPDFSADTQSGEILLDVQFANLSTGVIDTYEWDFGDGNTSTEVNPFYTYDEAGNYTVSLTATGPGGTTVETKTDFVLALPPTNILALPSIDVFSAEQDILHPILATSTEPIAGYQIVLEWDNSVTAFEDVTLANTVTEPLNPEFIFTGMDILPAGPGSTYWLALILDFMEPFDGRTIPAGQNLPLAYFQYDIPIGVNVGTVANISLVSGVYPPDTPLNNLISIDGGFTVLPFLSNAEVTVVPPGPSFLRADANSNAAVDLADAVFILAFLFTEGDEPTCPDAADSNDDGQINIGDAVYKLAYLFTNGEAPRYPFPGFGLDPTEDTLGPCVP